MAGPDGDHAAGERQGGGSSSLRYVTAVPLALLAGCGGITVVARAWNECDVGVNATANALGLLFLQFPVLAITHVVMLTGGYWLTGRSPVRWADAPASWPLSRWSFWHWCPGATSR